MKTEMMWIHAKLTNLQAVGPKAIKKSPRNQNSAYLDGGNAKAFKCVLDTLKRVARATLVWVEQ